MYFLLFIIFIILLASSAFAGFSAAPWLPTRKKELAQLIQALQIQNPKKLIDLGSGDGRILFALARTMPNLECHGSEIAIMPFLVSLFHKYLFFHTYKNVHLHYISLYKIDLRPYDAIVTFLLDSAYKRLMQKWSSELHPDAHLYIQAWPLPNIKPKQEIHIAGTLPLFIYHTHDLEK